ncbi:MAG TPA: hypothetical protein DEP69_04875, partial [Acidimicrobiaceae bacterium]|nr:hypothetical protein [Acidimicrobiaceae bacterium]
MTTHVWPTVPRFGELDPYGHVNHAVYISYFEAARCVALADVGMSLPDLAEADTQIIVSQIRVRFRAPAGAGDALRVETEVAEVKRASSVWAQRIVRA